ncbi:MULTISPECIES: hypothetical protein [Methylobacterium]|nr:MULTISPECIES: hypothetical protein [Methylobacterium]MDR7036669.1 hypothetical protein [Methylobacterium sp. BE186]
MALWTSWGRDWTALFMMIAIVALLAFMVFGLVALSYELAALFRP